MSIEDAILALTYILAVIPLIGRLLAIGASPKSYWVGYRYPACLERGAKAHFWAFIVLAVVWAACKKIGLWG